MHSGRNNLLSKMYIIPFLCILASGSLSAASIHQDESCKQDGDCPANYYCYTTTELCAPCQPNFCSRYNREDSWKKCHTEPTECGPCLMGYEEEVFSDGTNRAACIMSHQPTPAQAMGYTTIVEGGPYATYLSGVIGLPLTILLVGFFIFYNRTHRPVNRTPPVVEETELKPMCCQRKIENADSNIHAQPTAPMLPSYSREDAYNPYQNGAWEINEPCQNVYEHSIEIKRKPSTELLLQTAVFRKPNYEEDQQDSSVAGQDQEGEDPYETDSQEEEASSNRSVCPTSPPLQYHDENTMPSNWTPGPLAVEDENSNLQQTNAENAKRPSTEMGSSESEDEQSPKRMCNQEEGEQNEARSSSVLPNVPRTFTGALSSLRNQNSASNQLRLDSPQISPNHNENESIEN